MIAGSLLALLCERRFLYQALATLATFLALQMAKISLVRRRRYRLLADCGIPGPQPSARNGSLWVYDGKRRTERVFETDRKLAQEFGKCHSLFIGDHPDVVLSDLSKIRRVFLEGGAYFRERTFRDLLEPTLGAGVLFAPYHRWRPMRRAMSPAFSSYTVRGTSATQFLEDTLRLVTDYIDDKLSTSANVDKAARSAQLDIQSLLKSMSLYLISRMAVGLPVEVCEDERHVKTFDEFLQASDNLPIRVALALPNLLPLMQLINQWFGRSTIIDRVHTSVSKQVDWARRKLAEGRQGAPTASGRQLFDSLVRLEHEGKMSRPEVLGNADALLIAGYDTTSTSLTYMFWVLAKRPELQERLRGELRAHGIESQFLEQVIHETMRLYPAVSKFTTRLATQNFPLAEGCVIPRGARVTYDFMQVSRDPEVWPEPLEFRPERFAGGLSGVDACAFAPFGFAERKCLGYQLALLEMKATLCELLLRYRMRLVAPQELVLVPYGFVLTKPKEKVLLQLEKLL